MFVLVHFCYLSYHYFFIFDVLFFFFFKQKTAYEMRISDWSSDLCSSDLSAVLCGFWRRHPHHRQRSRRERAGLSGAEDARKGGWRQIGRASCRERVCQYV